MPDNGDETAGKTRRIHRREEESGQKQEKPKVYGMIGQRLRDYFDGVARQPIPDRFEELLKKLEDNGKPEQDK